MPAEPGAERPPFPRGDLAQTIRDHGLSLEVRAAAACDEPRSLVRGSDYY